MTEKISELKKDLAELHSLEKQATRTFVKNILSIEARKLASQVSTLEQEQVSSKPNVSSTSNATAAEKRYQVKINNYAWDQTSKYVKFYVTLQKIHTVPEESVSCNFTSKSLDLVVKNLENKDYVFTINNLLDSIDPAKSNWKVKTDMVIINAAKVKETSWSHVTELEKKISESRNLKTAPDEDADPSEGLMSLMKKMYETGDDEMKRTISKAWTESQMKSNNPL